MKQAAKYSTEYAIEHATRRAAEQATQRVRSSAAKDAPAGVMRRGAEIALVQIDATHEVSSRGIRTVPRDDAWPWDRVTPAMRTGAARSEASGDAWTLSGALYHEARRRRALAVGEAIAWTIGSARELFRTALAGYRRWREARATYETLAGLDDRALRDLGFVRDEIRSVVAEATGEAERSRRIVSLAD